jgi:hypothetical protein
MRGFVIEEEEGLWHGEEYAYHHLLTWLEVSSG